MMALSMRSIPSLRYTLKRRLKTGFPTIMYAPNITTGLISMMMNQPNCLLTVERRAIRRDPMIRISMAAKTA